MYLARRFINNRLHYLLRESYLAGDVYKNRDLINLGTDPGRFIVYPGGSSFYIDEIIFERLEQAGFQVDYDLVESFFLPFLDPYIRNRIDPFLARGANRSWKRTDREGKKAILAQTHIFDRRRIHFLRFGQTDLRDLDRSPSLYKILLEKSRDEIEQLMLDREQDLSPREYKSYLYAVFDLQRFFKEICARTMPHVLDNEKLDEFFLREICALDQDRSFWRGMDRDQGMTAYLKRYVIMFFDYSFPGGHTWDEFARIRMGTGFTGRRSRSSRRMSFGEVSTVFGVSQNELSAMSRGEFIRLYRKKAQQMHPDKGGDHNDFIELTNAYHEILPTKI